MNRRFAMLVFIIIIITMLIVMIDDVIMMMIIRSVDAGLRAGLRTHLRA